jgi:hypothetical protein
MWTKEEAPVKWEIQQAQTSFAKGFLAGKKGCVLALPADVPEKYFEMFGAFATWFHFAEFEDKPTYNRLFHKVRPRIGKDVMIHWAEFFHLPGAIIPPNKVLIIDFDSCGLYHRSFYFAFREIFKSHKLAQRSIIRWTFAQRGQMANDILDGVANIMRCAGDHGYKVAEQLPARSYAEVRHGRKGTPMLTGQFHLERI